MKPKFESNKTIIQLNYSTMKKLLLLMFLIPFLGIAQQITIKGTITDGIDPLPGVSVLEKGTTNGVSTDFNGIYSIKVAANATLEFSYVGYKSKKITVDASKKIIDITLEEDAQSLDEVVIRGFTGVIGKSRKRVSSIQSTPESVTALNSKGIENAGISDISSFATLVPNLKFNSAQAVGLNFISVRGIPQVRGGDAPLAFVVDGVTIPDPSLLSQDLYDLALVEVVKGPQGALYGKNAIGGAINIYTKEPTNKTSNRLKLGVGNGGNFQAQFISSGALKKDKVFYRFSSQYKNFDGLLTNDFLNEKVDFRKDINIRGQIKGRVSDDFTITGTYQYFDIDGGATYYSVNPIGSGGFPGGVLDPNPSEGNNVIDADILGRSDMKNSYGNIKMEYSFENTKLQSITSFNKVERSTSGDLDFISLDGFTQGEQATTNTFNQEIRLSNTNTDKKLDWSLGGFYQNTEKDVYQNGTTGVDFGGAPDLYDVADYVNEIQTIALFGFADYKLTEKLTASAGFRYDIDKFNQVDDLFVTTSERENNEFQPKVSLSYQASKNVLVYANYGKGYRNGGYNADATDLFNREFDDETSNNYELGFKTSSKSNRFIFNGSIFSSNLKNQQQYILDLNTFIAGVYNYDETKVFGFELDTRARLTNYLDVFASYGMADAEIVNGGSAGITDYTNYNGQKVPFVPVSSFGIGLESSFNITDEIKFNGFLNLDTTGKTYYHESNLAKHTTDAYSLLDARFGITYKKIKFELWGKNLTDQQYYQEFSPGEFVGSPDDVAWRGQPLSVGTSISINF
tara:strand:+ start:32529 stop:34919 length:2391 start_codon:yes stop_codon:yes gene_type:complete